MPTSLLKKLTLLFRLRGAGKVNTQVSGITARMNKLKASVVGVGRVGRTAFLGIAVALAVATAASAKAGATFESAMVQSQAIMGDLSDSIKRDMEDTARSVAKVTTFSAAEAAESYFFLASAGLDAAQSIAALPTVSKFAQAGMFDMARATDLLTDAQSALGLTIRDDVVKNMINMKRVSDVLVKANTLANATVEQFSESLTREAGAALKSFNIDVEEGVAVLAVFADQGVKAEIAGTSLSRILRLMTTAAVRNSDAYRDFGIEVFDSSGKIRNMADIVGDLTKGLGGLADKARVAALGQLGFQARVQGVILPLLGTADAMRKYEEELRKAQGTTDEIANKQLKSFSAQMGLLKDRIIDIGIGLKDKLLPVILDIATGFTRAIEAIPKFVKANKIAIQQVLLLVGAFGALALVFAVATNPFILIGIAILGMVGILNSSEPAVKNWANNVIRIITAVPIHIRKAWAEMKAQVFNPFKEDLDEAFAQIKGKFAGEFLKNSVTDFVGGGKEAAKGFTEAVIRELSKLTTKMREFFKGGESIEIPVKVSGDVAAVVEELSVLFRTMEEVGVGDIINEIFPPTIIERFNEILNRLDTFNEKLQFVGLNFKVAFGMKGVAAFGAMKGAGEAFYNTIGVQSKAFFSGESKRLINFGQLTNQIWRGAAAGALEAIATELRGRAEMWAIKALAATAEGFLGNPAAFKAAAGFAAAATAAGAGAALLGGAASGIRQKAGQQLAGSLEQPAPLTDAEIAAGVTRPGGASNLVSSGTITSVPARNINISVVTSIQGEIVNIGSGGIEEAAESLSELIDRRIEELVENGSLAG